MPHQHNPPHCEDRAVRDSHDSGSLRADSAPRTWWQRRRAAVVERAEAGLATAEYAVALIAAVGFAGLLMAILKGPQVKEMLTGIVQTALTIAS